MDTKIATREISGTRGSAPTHWSVRLSVNWMGLSADKYKSTYGIEQIENGVKLNFVTDHEHGTNVGSRLYLLDESGKKYKMFYLKNM